jgi:ribosomal protein S14
MAAHVVLVSAGCGSLDSLRSLGMTREALRSLGMTREALRSLGMTREALRSLGMTVAVIPSEVEGSARLSSSPMPR